MDPAVTLILERVANGEESAVGELLPIVYEELRRMAGSAMRAQNGAHTLQPTALVHEAYMRLVRPDGQYQNRAHFMAVATLAMRQVLMDHARRKKAARRGGGSKAAGDIEQIDVEAGQDVLDAVALSDALARLGGLDERRRQVVELRFFGGLTVPETAEVLGISVSTVEASWRAARAWLATELGRS